MVALGRVAIRDVGEYCDSSEPVQPMNIPTTTNVVSSANNFAARFIIGRNPCGHLS